MCMDSTPTAVETDLVAKRTVSVYLHMHVQEDRILLAVRQWSFHFSNTLKGLQVPKYSLLVLDMRNNGHVEQD